MNEGMSLKLPILCQKLVAMATSLEGSKVIYQVIKCFYMPTYPKILVKIGPLGFEIPGPESQLFEKK